MEFPRSNRLIAHVDMNSYFASVEQQANPHLRGKPLGVCAYLHDYGCVIAASVEAKKMGMKVGMLVKDAREAVPSARFVQNDPGKYRAVTSRVFALFHELSDRVEHYSIDEAFLDLTGWYRDAAEASFALSRTKQRITNEIGDWLRCSVGIAPTRFLAKTASDLKKPDGLTIITNDNLDDILSRLDLEDVCGIGPRMKRRLERIGFRTLMDIKNGPTENLIREFGVYGFFLQAKLQGRDIESVEQAGERIPKSFGHSYCVPDRVNREGKVPATLMRLVERAGRRMRSFGLAASGISVSVGLRTPTGPRPNGPFWTPGSDGPGGSAHVWLPEPADDSFTLVGATLKLLGELWKGESVNFLAVTLFEVSPPTGQVVLGLDYVGAQHAAPLQETTSATTATHTIVALGIPAPKADRDQDVRIDLDSGSSTTVSVPNGWRSASLLPPTGLGFLPYGDGFKLSGTDWDIVLRRPNGQLYIDPLILGLIDPTHAVVIARVSSAQEILIVNRAGSITKLTDIPDNVNVLGLVDGSVWWSTYIPGEGIESVPHGPSKLVRIEIDGSQTVETTSDEVINRVVALDRKIAYGTEGGTFSVVDAVGWTGQAIPLLWLSGGRLLALNGTSLVIQDGKTERRVSGTVSGEPDVTVVVE
jgi:DNA polymerase-4